MHILNNKHEYGTLQTTMELLNTCKKGWHINILEQFYIQLHYQKVTLINEQHPGEENPLFKIIYPSIHNTHAHNPTLTTTNQAKENRSILDTVQPNGVARKE
jgi:hypothetical protein